MIFEKIQNKLSAEFPEKTVSLISTNYKQQVILDLKPDGVEYQGHLFLGQNQNFAIVQYDTRTSWTAVAKSSFYEPNINQQYDQSQNVIVKLDDFVFQGHQLTEQICLNQLSSNNRTFESGNLCVKTIKILFADQMPNESELDTQGFIGLAPTQKNIERSIVHMLYRQGQIQQLKVGINYENPWDNNLFSSAIHFGYFDYSQIFGGEEGLNWYDNKAQDAWAINMDDLKYDGQEVQSTIGSKKAEIDSASINIQMPKREFNQLKRMFLSVDSSITEYVEPGTQGPVLVSEIKCTDLIPKLSDLQFTLHKTIVTIKPRGYLYDLDQNSGNCIIGVQSIDDSLNQYRLGSIFLRNFYVGLDFENNKILIGLNKNTEDASIQGYSNNPFQIKQATYTPLFVIFFLTITVLIAGCCYYKAKKQEKTKFMVTKLISENKESIN